MNNNIQPVWDKKKIKIVQSSEEHIIIQGAIEVIVNNDGAISDDLPCPVAKDMEHVNQRN